MEYPAKQFDVIVIGAGIMGSSTAYQTAKHGHKTLLLEQFDFLHHHGSSHGESRTIRTTYPENYYSAMVIESSKLWEEAEAEIGYKVLFKTTQFDMGPSDHKSLQSVIASCQSNSIPHQILDQKQVHEQFSGTIQLPENWVGVSTKLGGVLKPTKAVSMYQTLAFKHGAVLKDNTEVIDIKKDEQRGGVIVLTVNGDRFWGRKCVITVGPWMQTLVKKVSGQILPIQPLETFVYYWRIKEGNEAKFTVEGGFPTFASYGEPYFYGTPSLEFPGLIKLAMHGGLPHDCRKRKWAPAPAILDTLRKWIGERFRDLVDTNSGPVMTQSCMYSMTPDEDYVIDFLGGEFGKDVVIAGGFSGHGFKMAPVVGRTLAELVLSGETKGVDLRHFKIKRFEGNPKGNVKDFGDQVTLTDFSK